MSFLGVCDYGASRCSCSEEKLSLDEGHLKCATATGCSIYCQYKGFAAGVCGGPNKWDCECVDDVEENETEADDEATEDEARDNAEEK